MVVSPIVTQGLASTSSLIPTAGYGGGVVIAPIHYFLKKKKPQYPTWKEFLYDIRVPVEKRSDYSKLISQTFFNERFQNNDITVPLLKNVDKDFYIQSRFFKVLERDYPINVFFTNEINKEKLLRLLRDL